MYFTTHDAKVPFSMPECSISKIIKHHFHIDHNECESGIGYGIIITHDLMVQRVLLVNFKCQFIQWYGATLPMKEPNGLLGKRDITSREMRKVVIQAAEPVTLGKILRGLRKYLTVPM